MDIDRLSSLGGLAVRTHVEILMTNLFSTCRRVVSKPLSMLKRSSSCSENWFAMILSFAGKVRRLFEQLWGIKEEEEE